MSTRAQRDMWRQQVKGAMYSSIWEYCPEEFEEVLDELDAAEVYIKKLERTMAAIEKEGHKRGCPLCGVITRTNGDYVRHHDDDCALRRFDKNERPAARERA